MHTAYDPWGRRAAARTVPLDTALALRDEAQRAYRRAERAEARAVQLQAERDRVAEALAEATNVVPLPAPPAPAPVAEADADATLAAMERQIVDLRTDLANLRRHRDEAVARAAADARQQALAPVVDTLDDLDRALVGLPVGPMADGLRALRDRTARRLADAGTVPFAHPGDRFDPHRHEAIGVVDGPADTVVALERCGLATVDGAVIRPARVVVGSGRSA